MFSEKHYPIEVKGGDLDTYLEKGWYRMGQSIFTTHFLCFGSEFYSALWVRLPLHEYTMSKSLRKLHAKNQKHFRIEYGDFNITPEKEILYKKYRENFPAPLSPTLKESLLDLEVKNIFETREVCLYDGAGALVACSFFDVGEESAASILGIYDQKYASHSLGLYTMVLEILYCQEQGYKYYYPGYVVPGYSKFDYKLRIGKVSYYHLKSNTWKPFYAISKEETPFWEMEKSLLNIRKLLGDLGITAELKYYPMFEANLVSFSLTTYFDYPLVLHLNTSLGSDQNEAHFFMVVYNPKSGYFQFLHCQPFDSPFFYFKTEFIQSFNEDKKKFLLRLITVSEILFETNKIDDLLKHIVDFIRILSLK